MNRRSLLTFFTHLGLALPAGPAGAAPESDAARRDADVLEIVLLDLLTDPESPVEGRKLLKQIRFSPAPPERAPQLETVLRRYNAKAWERLSGGQVEAVKEGADDLARRAKARESLAAFHPKDARIVRSTREPDRNALRPQVFRAYPPGYTANGQLAVVHLVFPWSIHSGDTTYVLTKRADGWSIVLKQFVLYP